MITARELRLGNWVWNEVQNIPVKVGMRILQDQVYADKGFKEGWKPMPLTEEILIKNGFTKDTTNNTVWIDLQTHYLEFMEADGCFYPRYCQYGEISSEIEQCVSLNRIDSLHQLQNLYYALTGTELEINL